MSIEIYGAHSHGAEIAARPRAVNLGEKEKAVMQTEPTKTIFGLPVDHYEREFEVIYDVDGNVVRTGTDHVAVVRMEDGSLFRVPDDDAYEQLRKLVIAKYLPSR